MASLQPPNRPKSLDELRTQVGKQDREILDFCWSQYRTSGQHPKIRDVYFKFEKPKVDEAVVRLTGNLIRRAWSSNTPGEEYQVTDLGALVSADGMRLTRFLERYLEALKLLYDSNHDIRGINSKDLKPYLGRARQEEFTDIEFQDLGRLLVLGVRVLDTSAVGSNPDGTWYVNIGENIDDIRRVTDFKVFIQEELVKTFDPEEPVTEIERSNRQIRYNRQPFWPANTSLNGEGTQAMDVDTGRRTPFARLVESMKNHSVVSFVLLMLPVAGGVVAIANLWYSSVISEYRQKIEELSSELAKLQKEIVDLKKEATIGPQKKGSTK